MEFIKKFSLLLVFQLFFIGLFSQNTDTLNIFFEINQSNINTANKNTINNFIKEKSFSKIDIYGYTDFLGTVEYNKVLAQKRADAVKNQLIKAGVNPNIINESKGRGIYPESSEENRVNMNDRGLRDHRKVMIIAKIEPITKQKTEEETAIAEPLVEDDVEEEIMEYDTDKIEDNFIGGEEGVVIPIFRDLSIKDVEVGSSIVLQNILFYGGTHRVKPESAGALRQLLHLMRTNPDLHIRIEGHICCHDGPGDGFDYDANDHHLSENRARTIYDFLVENGIHENRLSYIGHSSKYRLYPEERTARERELNRRVEIVILEK